MIQTFFLGLFGTSFAYLSYLILKPLIELILLKLKHGKDIEIEFMPILGESYFQNRAQSLHKDILHYKRNILLKNPGVKMLASNFFLDKIILTIVDPLLIKQFLQTPESYKRYQLQLFNEIILSQALAFKEEQQWKDQRKILGHQFSFENLKRRFPIIKESTKRNLTELIKIDQEVKLSLVTQKITSDVITSSFFGSEFRNQLVNGLTVTDAAVECIVMQAELSLKSLWTHFRGLIFGYKSDIPQFFLTSNEKVLITKMNNLKTFIYEGMAKREEAFEQNEIEQNQDFIQTYLAESKKNTQLSYKEELVKQFVTFALAADSTSSFNTISCYVLSQKADLQEELRSHIKSHVNSFEDLTLPDLLKMDKLSAFLQEVLRLYPPASGVAFRTARQQHQLGNFTIKPSYLIDCGILPVQQSPKYYEKSEEFNINRWLNNDLKEPFAYIAFSSGPRNCIGQNLAMMEAKIMLIFILLTYKLIPDINRQLEMGLTLLYVPVDDRLVQFQLL